MKITKMNTHNTKGRNIDVELSGKDIFVGENGSGKTTHLESFIGGVIGHIPSRGKTLSDFFKMSSGKEMEITLQSDTGFSCTRTIKERATKKRGTGEKSYSLHGAISVFPPKENIEPKNRIAEEFGDFTIMFDIDEFFNMSNDKQRSFIFSMLGDSNTEWGNGKILEAVSSKARGNNDIVEKIMSIWSDGVPVRSNIMSMLSWAKDELSAARKNLKRAIATKETLLKQKQEVGSLQRPIVKIKEELDNARTELNNVSKAISANEEKASYISSIENRIRSIRRKLSEIPECIHESYNVEKFRKIIEDNKRKEIELVSMQEGIQEVVDKSRSEYRSCSELIANLKAKKQVMSEQKDTIDGSSGRCPLLLQKCELEDELKSKSQEISESIKDISVEIELNSKILAEIDCRGKEAASSLRSICSDQKSLHYSNTEAIEVINKARKSEEDSEIRAKNISALNEDLDSAKREIAGLAACDQSQLLLAKDGLDSRINKLESELRQMDEVNDLLKSFDRAKIDAIELEEDVDILDDMCILLGPSMIQGSILKESIGPLESTINNLLSKTSDEYNIRIDLVDNNGKETFDMFWVKGDSEIPLTSVSGGEKVIFSTAILIAIVLLRDPPLKALCIEASEVDEKNLTMMLNAINDFGDCVDNFLIATHVVTEQVHGWNVHKLQ